jgi:hypothetical protein
LPLLVAALRAFSRFLSSACQQDGLHGVRFMQTCHSGLSERVAQLTVSEYFNDGLYNIL